MRHLLSVQYLRDSIAARWCEWWHGDHEWEPGEYEDGSIGWYCLNCGVAGSELSATSGEDMR